MAPFSQYLANLLLKKAEENGEPVNLFTHFSVRAITCFIKEAVRPRPLPQPKDSNC